MVFVFIILLILAASKLWRAFIETSKDIRPIRLMEPWYWFFILNLMLSVVTSNYDYQFILIGLLIQVALSVWFGISVGWIIQSCPHKTGVLKQSWLVRGETLKFCYRCGTRLPKEFHAHLIKDSSWQYFLFQIPPHLFKFISFWVAQSVVILISLFVVLRVLKNPDSQHTTILTVVILVLLAPPVIYYLGRFRRYLSENKGMIWWEDFKGPLVIWVVVGLIVWVLLRFWA